MTERNKNMLLAVMDAHFPRAQQCLDRSHFVVLYQVSGVLAGLLLLCREPADEWTSRWRLDKMCVRESKRNTGIGTEMLEYALADVCAGQPVAVHLEYTLSNFTDLVRFFEKRAFRAEDEHLLHRTLLHMGARS